MERRDRLYNKTKQELRDRHIAAWRQSGLSRKAYCRQQNIRPSTFANWVKKDSTGWPVELVAVPDELCQLHQSATPTSSGLSLVFGRCCRIEIAKQFDAETFVRLVAVVEGI
jgi:hypothetical protein